MQLIMLQLDSNMVSSIFTATQTNAVSTLANGIRPPTLLSPVKSFPFESYNIGEDQGWKK